MLAVGRWTREGRCQPVKSKVAKPVRASGTGTPQKEAWPEAVGTCQAAQSCFVERHQVGEGSAGHPRLPHAESPAGPATGTQQHLKVLSDHPRQRQIQQWAANLVGPSPGDQGPAGRGPRTYRLLSPHRPSPVSSRFSTRSQTRRPCSDPLWAGAATREERGTDPSPSSHQSLFRIDLR